MTKLSGIVHEQPANDEEIAATPPLKKLQDPLTIFNNIRQGDRCDYYTTM